MYYMAKSCVRQNNVMSEYFFMQHGCQTRGSHVSYTFALFINDFYKYIDGKYRGLSINNWYPTLLENYIAMLNCLYCCMLTTQLH